VLTVLTLSRPHDDVYGGLLPSRRIRRLRLVADFDLKTLCAPWQRESDHVVYSIPVSSSSRSSWLSLSALICVGGLCILKFKEGGRGGGEAVSDGEEYWDERTGEEFDFVGGGERGEYWGSVSAGVKRNFEGTRKAPNSLAEERRLRGGCQ